MNLALFLLMAGQLDHSLFDTLLKRYVNEQSRVDYAALKQQAAGLDAYLQHIAEPWPSGLPMDEEKASLINAYNALTIRWILENYPVPSIWKTKKPFSVARHKINGVMLSLDAIETKLRAMKDPRIHAALVCAARSCPPLRREAYVASRVNQQLDDNAKAWLTNPALNSFDPRRTSISMIFKWYRGDFEDLDGFLAKYSNAYQRGTRVDHKSYHWGLNDSGQLGENYSTGLGFYLDFLRNR